LVIGIWTVAYSAITGQQPSGNLDSVLGDGLGTGVWLVVNMLVIAIIGPTIEEIFFRGLGLRSALASTLRRAGLPPSTFAAFQMALEVCQETGFVDTLGGAARLRRRMVERVLTHCETDPQAAEPLLILLRRFATESAREEARMFCDELLADEMIAPIQHDLIAA